MVGGLADFVVDLGLEFSISIIREGNFGGFKVRATSRFSLVIQLSRDTKIP
jgi:hypothetical protein